MSGETLHRYSPLTVARLALLDLLIGREFRLLADDALREALHEEHQDDLYFEVLGRPSDEANTLVDRALERARQLEWIAQRSELGEILWGGRFNRCGYQPASDP